MACGLGCGTGCGRSCSGTIERYCNNGCNNGCHSTCTGGCQSCSGGCLGNCNSGCANNCKDTDTKLIRAQQYIDWNASYVSSGWAAKTNPTAGSTVITAAYANAWKAGTITAGNIIYKTDPTAFLHWTVTLP